MNKQFNKLEWWQDISKSVEKTEIIKSLVNNSPEFRSAALDSLIREFKMGLLASKLRDIDIENELLSSESKSHL